jgi:hypothetical protein
MLDNPKALEQSANVFPGFDAEVQGLSTGSSCWLNSRFMPVASDQHIGMAVDANSKNLSSFGSWQWRLAW